jgi:hypothetical protein
MIWLLDEGSVLVLDVLARSVVLDVLIDVFFLVVLEAVEEFLLDDVDQF